MFKTAAFLFGFILLAFPAAADSPIEKFSPDNFCFVMAEMHEGAKDSKEGLRMNDVFTIKSVMPDCPQKKVSLVIAVRTTPKKFEDKDLNGLLCAEGGGRLNPYRQAVQNEWALDVSLVFPDGTKKAMKLCQ